MRAQVVSQETTKSRAGASGDACRIFKRIGDLFPFRNEEHILLTIRTEETWRGKAVITITRLEQWCPHHRLKRSGTTLSHLTGLPSSLKNPLFISGTTLIGLFCLAISVPEFFKSAPNCTIKHFLLPSSIPLPLKKWKGTVTVCISTLASSRKVSTECTPSFIVTIWGRYCACTTTLKNASACACIAM